MRIPTPVLLAVVLALYFLGSLCLAFGVAVGLGYGWSPWR